MCRVCRARGLIRGARHGGGPNGLTVVHGPLPVVDHDDDGEDDILCSVATADDDAHATTFPPSPPRTVRVVVGAGVAGTCCAEELCRLRPEDAVILVTIGDVVKSVQHVEKVTRNIEVFDVVERPVSALGHENLTVYRAHAVAMDRLKKELYLEREDQEDSKIGKRDHEEEEAKQTLSGFKPRDVKTWTLRYDQLVVCSGAAPRGIFSSSQKQTTEENQTQTQTQTQTQNKTAAAVTVTVRDVESVCELRQRLRTARRALLVGNGGIAMELADALCRASGSASTGGSVSKISKHVSLNKEKDQLHTRELVWAAKHCTIGDAFFDRDASAFLQTLAERSGCMQDACATGASRLGSNERGGGGWKNEKHADGEGNGASLSAGTGKRVKRKRGTHETEGTVSRPNSPTAVLSRETAFGNAAGPDWVSRLGAGVRGKHGSGNSGCEKFGLKILNDVHLVDVEAWGGVEEGKERGDEGDAKEKEGKYGTETETETEKWPAVAVLSDGRRLGVDVIVAATGVDASVRVDWLPTEHFPRGKDGGIAVTETFQSIGDPCVFAAGDAASAETRTADTSTHWFQMRTWSQARSSGTYVARVMVGDADSEVRVARFPNHRRLCSHTRLTLSFIYRKAFGFNYELFTHTTIFFGKKCVLLGRYNGQKFGEEDAGDLKSYARSTFSDESDSPKDSGEVEPDVFRGGAAGSNQSKSTDTSTFVRVLLHKNKMVGAVLLGNTDLEETFENLILDQIDLARFGASLLDPEVDLEDYFD